MASTEAVTEASLSEVASSGELSPHRKASSCEALTSTTSIQSWADEADSDSESGDEEQGQKKRARRSHRRRRNRRRGKGGSKKAKAELLEDCAGALVIEEGAEVPRVCCDAPGSLSLVDAIPERAPPCNAAAWPLAAQQSSCQSVLPVAALINSQSSSSMAPVGVLSSTSPSAVHCRSPCEASARTPPNVGLLVCAHAVAPMMPSKPSVVAMATPGHAAYQGAFVSQMPAVYTFTPGLHQTSASVYMCVGSPCPVQGAPTVLPPGSSPPGTAFMPAQVSASASPPVFGPPFPTNAFMDPTVLWLAGGLQTSVCDLVMRLQAAAPDVYED